jgi:hypothetical protein
MALKRVGGRVCRWLKCQETSYKRSLPSQVESHHESNDHAAAAGIRHPAGQGWILSIGLRKRGRMVRADAECTGCCAKGSWTVSVNDAPVGQLLHR